MKYFLLTLLFFSSAKIVGAQQAQVSQLPAGVYESKFKSTQQKWSAGDITLMPSGKYILSNGEPGEYRFSAAAQRVFFTSGTLKAMYATTTLVNDAPVIIFPANESQPLQLSADVWATYKR